MLQGEVCGGEELRKYLWKGEVSVHGTNPDVREKCQLIIFLPTKK